MPVMKWDTAVKIKTLVIAHHLFFALGLLFFDLSHAVVAIFSYVLFGKIGGEIALHRYFSHKSFQTNPLTDKVLIFLSVGAGLGSPLSWAATHRLHHKHEDKADDPHSPHHQHPWRVWTTFWRPFLVSQKMISDLTKDPVQRFVHKHYFALHIAMWFPAIALAPTYAPYIFSFPCIYGFHLAGAVNFWGHSPQIRNVYWLNFFAFGDALHLNHHRHPSLYTTAGSKLLEFDFCGWLIRNFLKK